MNVETFKLLLFIQILLYWVFLNIYKLFHYCCIFERLYLLCKLKHFYEHFWQILTNKLSVTFCPYFTCYPYVNLYHLSIRWNFSYLAVSLWGFRKYAQFQTFFKFSPEFVILHPFSAVLLGNIDFLFSI